ncbi:MAG: hypothetical protein QM831_37520 [Kofleriaceae bacterium]
MADLTLRLRVDPNTGRREIVIDYSSDSDALPFEHEEEHRQLAEKVINGGLKNPKLEVDREGDNSTAEQTPEEQGVAQPTANKS